MAKSNISSKYADLPGIASDQPDVYETSDLPESEQISGDAILDQSENVETLSISATDAYEKFKEKKMDASFVDFTDRVRSTRQTGYNVTSGDWEMLGDAVKEKETPQQRYQRLQYEIRELTEEISAAKQSAKEEKESEQMSPVILAKQVEALQQQLVGLNLQQLLGSEVMSKLDDPQKSIHKKLVSHLESFKGNVPKTQKGDKKSAEGGSSITYELHYKPEHSKMDEIAKGADLEQRLKKLESFLGQDEAKLSPLTVNTNEKSLMSAVSILSAKLSLLEPSHLDQVESRLVALQQRMQQLGEKRVLAEEAEKSGKVSELYELMRKADAMSASVPHVVERLVALQQLHEQALQFSKALTQLDTAQQQVVATLDSNRTILKGVENLFSKNNESITKNIASLETRLLALKK